MDWRFVWIFALTVLTVIAAQPLGMGEMGDLYGGQTMGANHVPRLGRRSLSPLFKNNGFRFFGRAPSRNRAGFLGPLFSDRYENFRYYGGRPGEELARGLLRDKRQQEEYSDLLSLQADKADVGKEASVTAVPAEASTKTKANKPDIDQDYWKNVIGEATINNVLEKMAQIGETREMIEDFNQYKAFGVGNPLPKYLARWNHPVNSPKASVPKTSYPNKDPLNKYKSYYPQSSVAFPRRKKGRTFTRIF